MWWRGERRYRVLYLGDCKKLVSSPTPSGLPRRWEATSSGKSFDGSGEWIGSASVSFNQVSRSLPDREFQL
jgi:hypothetical protein